MNPAFYGNYGMVPGEQYVFDAGMPILYPSRQQNGGFKVQQAPQQSPVYYQGRTVFYHQAPPPQASMHQGYPFPPPPPMHYQQNTPNSQLQYGRQSRRRTPTPPAMPDVGQFAIRPLPVVSPPTPARVTHSNPLVPLPPRLKALGELYSATRRNTEDDPQVQHVEEYEMPFKRQKQGPVEVIPKHGLKSDLKENHDFFSKGKENVNYEIGENQENIPVHIETWSCPEQYDHTHKSKTHGNNENRIVNDNMIVKQDSVGQERSAASNLGTKMSNNSKVKSEGITRDTGQQGEASQMNQTDAKGINVDSEIQKEERETQDEEREIQNEKKETQSEVRELSNEENEKLEKEMLNENRQTFNEHLGEDIKVLFESHTTNTEKVEETGHGSDDDSVQIEIEEHEFMSGVLDHFSSADSDCESDDEEDPDCKITKLDSCIKNPDELSLEEMASVLVKEAISKAILLLTDQESNDHGDEKVVDSSPETKIDSEIAENVTSNCADMKTDDNNDYSEQIILELCHESKSGSEIISKNTIGAAIGDEKWEDFDNTPQELCHGSSESGPENVTNNCSWEDEQVEIRPRLYSWTYSDKTGNNKSVPDEEWEVKSETTVSSIESNEMQPTIEKKDEDFEKFYFKRRASKCGISISSPVKAGTQNSETTKPSVHIENERIGYNPKDKLNIQRSYSEEWEPIGCVQNMMISQRQLNLSQSEDSGSDVNSLHGSQSDPVDEFKIKATRRGIRIVDPNDSTDITTESDFDSEIEPTRCSRSNTLDSLKDENTSTPEHSLKSLNPEVQEFKMKSLNQASETGGLSLNPESPVFQPGWKSENNAKNVNLENPANNETKGTRLNPESPVFSMRAKAQEFIPGKYQDLANAASSQESSLDGSPPVKKPKARIFHLLSPKVNTGNASVGTQASPTTTTTCVGTRRVKTREFAINTGSCDTREVAINTGGETEDERFIRIRSQPKLISKSTNTGCEARRSLGVNVNFGSPTKHVDKIDASTMTDTIDRSDDMDKAYLTNKVKALQMEMMSLKEKEVISKLVQQKDMLKKQSDKLSPLFHSNSDESEIFRGLIRNKISVIEQTISLIQLETQRTLLQITSKPGVVIDQLPDLQHFLEPVRNLPSMYPSTNSSQTYKSPTRFSPIHGISLFPAPENVQRIPERHKVAFSAPANIERTPERPKVAPPLNVASCSVSNLRSNANSLQSYRDANLSPTGEVGQGVRCMSSKLSSPVTNIHTSPMRLPVVPEYIPDCYQHSSAHFEEPESKMQIKVKVNSSQQMNDIIEVEDEEKKASQMHENDESHNCNEDSQIAIQELISQKMAAAYSIDEVHDGSDVAELPVIESKQEAKYVDSIDSDEEGANETESKPDCFEKNELTNLDTSSCKSRIEYKIQENLEKSEQQTIDNSSGKEQSTVDEQTVVVDKMPNVEIGASVVQDKVPTDDIGKPASKAGSMNELEEDSESESEDEDYATCESEQGVKSEEEMVMSKTQIDIEASSKLHSESVGANKIPIDNISEFVVADKIPIDDIGQSVVADKMPVDDVGGSVCADKMPIDEIVESVGADKMPIDDVGGSVCADNMPIDEISESVVADKMPIDEISESVGADKMPIDEISESVVADKMPIDDIGQSVVADKMPIDEISESVVADKMPIDDIGESVVADKMPIDENSESVVADKMPIDEISESVVADKMPIDEISESVVADKMPIDDTGESDSKAGSMNELEESTESESEDYGTCESEQGVKSEEELTVSKTQTDTEASSKLIEHEAKGESVEHKDNIEDTDKDAPLFVQGKVTDISEGHAEYHEYSSAGLEVQSLPSNQGSSTGDLSEGQLIQHEESVTDMAGKQTDPLLTDSIKGNLSEKPLVSSKEATGAENLIEGQSVGSNQNNLTQDLSKEKAISDQDMESGDLTDDHSSVLHKVSTSVNPVEVDSLTDPQINMTKGITEDNSIISHQDKEIEIEVLAAEHSLTPIKTKQEPVCEDDSKEVFVSPRKNGSDVVADRDINRTLETSLNMNMMPGMGAPVPGPFPLMGELDPVLFQAVMGQLIQAYPQMMADQVMLTNVAMQQTHLLQMYMKGEGQETAASLPNVCDFPGLVDTSIPPPNMQLDSVTAFPTLSPSSSVHSVIPSTVTVAGTSVLTTSDKFTTGSSDLYSLNTTSNMDTPVNVNNDIANKNDANFVKKTTKDNVYCMKENKEVGNKNNEYWTRDVGKNSHTVKSSQNHIHTNNHSVHNDNDLMQESLNDTGFARMCNNTHKEVKINKSSHNGKYIPTSSYQDKSNKENVYGSSTGMGVLNDNYNNFGNFSRRDHAELPSTHRTDFLPDFAKKHNPCNVNTRVTHKLVNQLDEQVLRSINNSDSVHFVRKTPSPPNSAQPGGVFALSSDNFQMQQNQHYESNKAVSNSRTLPSRFPKQQQGHTFSSASFAPSRPKYPTYGSSNPPCIQQTEDWNAEAEEFPQTFVLQVNPHAKLAQKRKFETVSDVRPKSNVSSVKERVAENVDKPSFKQRSSTGIADICDIPVPSKTVAPKTVAKDIVQKVATEVEKEEEWFEVKGRKRYKSQEQPAKKVNQTHSAPGKQQKMSNFEKLIGRLQEEFPGSSRNVIIDAVTKIRTQRGSLTGLSMEKIVESAHLYIEKPKKYIPGLSAPPGTSATKNVLNIPRFTQAALSHNTRPGQAFHQSTSASKTVLNLPKFTPPSIIYNVGYNNNEDICVICHDVLSMMETKELECHHIYHYKCISQWVERERTCPTCRKHALFPEDFPRLGK